MSTALYRRYRPETFADVIGQEHVTEPLMAALRADRVTHAYLFSGPRGCGKTTSARILARCLNCAQGPTDTPCGTCDSCVELARGGSGSLDVVEIDAASHNGVDDARELRERAAFAPARDRYKIFILDEAHMVTAQGFNALLKLVEEPPEHVKFIFATTEPDKVIGTIRSRTHHYPFRLVPPEQLQEYLEQLCTAEGVQVDAGVLPMVVRAGGGSVRDSLSVLDQLIAGAQDGALDYQRAVALLGYTDAALLDDVVDAIAAHDGASVFRVVDRVIASGHDPRRFVEDLLQRLRDVVVIAMAGDHAAAALRGLPADQLDRMRVQAQHLGAAQASRAADLVNDALTEMGGATSPRLHLELLCARLLLPAADDGARGFGARLDRLEHTLATGAAAAPAASGAAAQAVRVGAASQPVATVPRPTAPAERPASGTTGGDVAEGRRRRPEPDSQAGPGPAPDGDAGDRPARSPQPPGQSRASDRPARSPQPPGQAGASEADAAAPDTDRAGAGPRTPSGGTTGPGTGTTAPGTGAAAAGGPGAGAPAQADQDPGTDVEMIRRRWPEVVATLGRLKRTTWALVSQNAQVGGVGGGVLRLSFTTSGLATTFRTGPHAEPVQRALAETLGVQLRVEAVIDEGGGPGPGRRGGPDGLSGPGGRDAGGRDRGETPRGQGPDLAGDGPSAGTSASHGSWSPDGAVAPHGRSAGPVEAARSSWDAPPSAPSAERVPSEAAREPAYAGAPARRPAEPEQRSATRPAPPSPPSAPGPAQRVAGQPGTAASASSPAGTAVDEQVPPSERGETADHRVAPADDTPSMDDPEAEGSGMVGVPLVAKLLGGTVIDEGPVPAPGQAGP